MVWACEQLTQLGHLLVRVIATVVHNQFPFCGWGDKNAQLWTFINGCPALASLGVVRVFLQSGFYEIHQVLQTDLCADGENVGDADLRTCRPADLQTCTLLWIHVARRALEPRYCGPHTLKSACRCLGEVLQGRSMTGSFSSNVLCSQQVPGPGSNVRVGSKSQWDSAAIITCQLTSKCCASSCKQWFFRTPITCTFLANRLRKFRAWSLWALRNWVMRQGIITRRS